MVLFINGGMIDVEAVQDRHKDHGCNFNSTCINTAWAMKFDVPVDDPLVAAVAKIYLDEYVVLELVNASNSLPRFACYVGPHSPTR